MTHKELLDSAASYALDALDGDERTAFEAHLPTCQQCQTEVAAYREVAGALALAAPDAAPPASDLRARILRDAQAVRPLSSAPARRPRRLLIPWLAAAAGIVVAVVSGVAYRAERGRAARLTMELASARAELARSDSTLAAFIGPEVHVVSLSVADAKPAVRVFWNHTRNVFIVTASALPPAPPGKTYQLWAMPKGKPPISMGTFDTDAAGRTATVIAVSGPITDAGFIDQCGLTLEPDGGSPQPTESPRLIGAWRHVD